LARKFSTRSIGQGRNSRPEVADTDAARLDSCSSAGKCPWQQCRRTPAACSENQRTAAAHSPIVHDSELSRPADSEVPGTPQTVLEAAVPSPFKRSKPAAAGETSSSPSAKTANPHTATPQDAAPCMDGGAEAVLNDALVPAASQHDAVKGSHSSTAVQESEMQPDVSQDEPMPASNKEVKLPEMPSAKFELRDMLRKIATPHGQQNTADHSCRDQLMLVELSCGLKRKRLHLTSSTKIARLIEDYGKVVEGDGKVIVVNEDGVEQSADIELGRLVTEVKSAPGAAPLQLQLKLDDWLM